VKHWLKDNLKVDYVDVITEPGMDKLMAEGSLSAREAIRQKVMISVNVHDSHAIAVVGHDDCAGNPVSQEAHLKQIRRGVDAVKTWVRGIEVLGLWVNENWEVEKVA
jgi:carbonic anhydrase